MVAFPPFPRRFRLGINSLLLSGSLPCVAPFFKVPEGLRGTASARMTLGCTSEGRNFD